jgi:hypothetical protein
MGGVAARAQVSRISAAEAEKVMPEIRGLPIDSQARNAIIFEPRTDVERIIFIATPHRGSDVAMGNLAALGMRLIDVPDWIASELESLSVDAGQLPTSIHGLSPKLAVPSNSRPVPTRSASPLDYRRSWAGQQIKQFRWRRVLFELALGFRGVRTHDSDRTRRIRPQS